MLDSLISPLSQWTFNLCTQLKQSETEVIQEIGFRKSMKLLHQTGCFYLYSRTSLLRSVRDCSGRHMLYGFKGSLHRGIGLHNVRCGNDLRKGKSPTTKLTVGYKILTRSSSWGGGRQRSRTKPHCFRTSDKS